MKKIFCQLFTNGHSKNVRFDFISCKFHRNIWHKSNIHLILCIVPNSAFFGYFAPRSMLQRGHRNLLWPNGCQNRAVSCTVLSSLSLAGYCSPAPEFVPVSKTRFDLESMSGSAQTLLFVFLELHLESNRQIFNNFEYFKVFCQFPWLASK